MIRSIHTLLCLLIVCAGQQEPEHRTAPAIAQTPVDYNHPTREYFTRTIHGWRIFVEKQLVQDAPDLAKRALERLDKKLDAAQMVLPTGSLRDLRKLKIFLMYGPRATGGGRDNGLEYFRSNAAEYNSWLDPRMARGIVIYSAENYTQISDFWALKALVHEFGHAQHLEHWPEDRADIYETWSHAIKTGLYKEVRNEDKGASNPNYAARNHLEYFAELTAMYFVGCDYYPADRATLKAYDPDGYALIEKLWGIHNSSNKRRKDSQ